MQLPHSFMFLSFAALSTASATNTTFDDSDSSFSFIASWNVIAPTSPCDICSSRPDPAQILDGTWHDGNIRNGSTTGTSGSFTFQGTAVYIFGIDQTWVQSDIAFNLGEVQAVHRYTGPDQFAYNALFFSATGLAADHTHTVSWELELADSGVEVQVALFDYAIVTSQVEDIVSSVAPSKTLARLSSSFVPPPTSLNTHSSTHTRQAGSSSLHPSTSHTSPVSDQQPSTITQDKLTTITSTPTPQSVRSQSNHLGVIIGATVAALVVAVALLLLLFLRSRRTHLLRAKFLHIEDYPLDLHQNSVALQPKEILSASVAESSGNSVMVEPRRDSGTVRALEERLTTLEERFADQQPPPYIHE